jgi:hypothetical protein
VPEVLCPLATAEVAEISSARDAITVEEVMQLTTCRYMDFPGVGIIDLEAPQLPEKVLEVATERMFSELSIMETIASVMKVVHEYERAGSFVPAVALEPTNEALEALATSMEPTADASVPPPANENRGASLLQPTEATAVVVVTGVAEAIVGEVGTSPPLPVAADANEARALDEPTAAAQEQAAPEGTARVASPEIQEVEETGVSLS